MIRSSSVGEVDGPPSESLEFELTEGARSGLAGAWLTCSMLFDVPALAGVFPVVELLLEPIFGGISRDSLDGFVGGGLDRALVNRLELDESEGPLIAPLDEAACKELRALCCCVDNVEVDDDAAVTFENGAAAEFDDDDDDVD